MEARRGEHYRLEQGKGYGQANWWVLSLDGRTEVAGGLLRGEAEEIFERCEKSMRHPAKYNASLNTSIIDLEAEQREEDRRKYALHNKGPSRDS